MDYYGLFPKFKFNRPLKADEKKNQLKQNEKINLDGQSVVPDLKVIAMNSHFLELVDKYFAAKGLMSLLASQAVIMLTLATLALFDFLNLVKLKCLSLTRQLRQRITGHGYVWTLSIL